MTAPEKTLLKQERNGKIHSYDPPFTPWKVTLTRVLHDQFAAMIPLDLERFREIWEPLLNSLSERRKVQIPQDFQL